jgi:pyrroloquinoline quinone biosynthesis protein B
MVIIQVLGTMQNGGIPQFGCRCKNCLTAHHQIDYKRYVASIAISGSKKTFLVDATPNINKQLFIIKNSIPHQFLINNIIDGIIITHLHIGHYIGLLYLGREAASTKNIPVYVTPEVKIFFLSNKPFSYLIERKQIDLYDFIVSKSYSMDKDLIITPFEVIHRNEDGNTIGLEIENTNTRKKIIYIPDIDMLTPKIKEKIIKVDYVIFDGTFYSNNEIPNQNEVPHPTMKSIIKEFGSRPEKNFYFTHMNHSNPTVNPDSNEIKQLKELGYNITKEGQIIQI